jgi:hypothetical protein
VHGLRGHSLDGAHASGGVQDGSSSVRSIRWDHPMYGAVGPAAQWLPCRGPGPNAARSRVARLEPAAQHWPWLKKSAKDASLTACSTSTSGHTITGDCGWGGGQELPGQEFACVKARALAIEWDGDGQQRI